MRDRVVYAGYLIIRTMDIQPASPGHALVIPKGPYENQNDFAARASEAEMVGFMRALGKVAEMVGLTDGGYRAIANCGLNGGQEVPHFHLHVQPRRHGDGLLEVYPMGVPAPSTMAQLEPLAARLRNALGGGSQQVPAPQHAAQ